MSVNGILSIFFNTKVSCVFSLQSPHQVDYNEYTQHNIFSIKKKITLNFPKSVAMDFFFQGTPNKFKTARVNKPSGFEPLKFYCMKTDLPVQTHITKMFFITFWNS